MNRDGGTWINTLIREWLLIIGVFTKACVIFYCRESGEAAFVDADFALIDIVANACLTYGAVAFFSNKIELSNSEELSSIC